MIKFFKVILIYSITLFFSCEFEKEIDYQANFPADKIVVNGIISAQGVKVLISKTVPPNNPAADSQINNAKVALFADNNLLFFLEKSQDGYYFSPQNFIPNKNTGYYIKVTAESLPEVQSTAQFLPETIQLDTAYYIQDANDDFLNHLFYSFNDPAENSNYYSERFYRYAGGENIDSWRFNEFINPYEVYSDTEFSGKTKTISDIFYRNGTTDSGQDVAVDSLQIILYSLSGDLYFYLSSITKYETTSQDPWFEQPSVVFTNISGGFGIFAAFSADTLSLKYINN